VRGVVEDEIGKVLIWQQTQPAPSPIDSALANFCARVSSSAAALPGID